MAFALALSAVAGAVLLAAAYLMLRRWVLTPLDDLSDQLRSVAQDGERTRVITPSGPPELRAVGVDAESMRRALVAEGDAARQADEALELESPVIAAIRDQLDSETDPEAARLAVHGQLHPAQGVLAGDWWGTVALPDGRTALLVVDVSGHGPLAGLVSLRLRSVMTVALRSGFDAGTALDRAATSFADGVDGRFATALAIVLDPVSGELSWANAGHPEGWLLPAGATHERLHLSATGPLLSPLGGTWVTRSADFEVGDVVLAWSDGLVETRDASTDISDDALAALVDAVDTREPRELVPRLLAELREGAPEWHRDDVTLVAVRRET
jgi:sigma-B regulation protein RsbU (phosphoserine phosphatase)